MMTRVNSAEVKKQLGQILERTVRTKRWVMVTSRGRDVAAGVPIEDVQLLEEIEDRLDPDGARAALTSVKREGTGHMENNQAGSRIMTWTLLYQIEFSRQADRQFRNLSSQIQQRLKPRSDSLVTMPRPHGCEKLSGVDQLYRIQVGDYRIIYAMEDNRLLVLVVK